MKYVNFERSPDAEDLTEHPYDIEKVLSTFEASSETAV